MHGILLLLFFDWWNEAYEGDGRWGGYIPLRIKHNSALEGQIGCGALPHEANLEANRLKWIILSYTTINSYIRVINQLFARSAHETHLFTTSSTALTPSRVASTSNHSLWSLPHASHFFTTRWLPSSIWIRRSTRCTCGTFRTPSDTRRTGSVGFFW